MADIVTMICTFILQNSFFNDEIKCGSAVVIIVIAVVKVRSILYRRASGRIQWCSWCWFCECCRRRERWVWSHCLNKDTHFRKWDVGIDCLRILLITPFWGDTTIQYQWCELINWFNDGHFPSNFRWTFLMLFKLSHWHLWVSEM